MGEGASGGRATAGDFRLRLFPVSYRPARRVPGNLRFVSESPDRRPWPRLVVVMPPDVADALRDLSIRNLRDRRSEALRLICDGLAREAERAATVASERLP